MSYLIGLDIGQMQDPTAIAIIEQSERAVADDALDLSTVHPIPTGANSMRIARTRVEYDVVHLERMPLGTSYPAVVDRVAKMLLSSVLVGNHVLIVDQTGVGRAVVDMLDAAQLYPVGVTITNGDAESHEEKRWDRLRVPKRDLVAAVQVLLQSQRLRIVPRLKDTKTLVQELKGFKVKVTTAGNDTYGNWRDGEHDDMVLAVALAAWYGEKIGFAGQRAEPYRLEAGWERMGRRSRMVVAR